MNCWLTYSMVNTNYIPKNYLVNHLITSWWLISQEFSLVWSCLFLSSILVHGSSVHPYFFVPCFHDFKSHEFAVFVTGSPMVFPWFVFFLSHDFLCFFPCFPLTSIVSLVSLVARHGHHARLDFPALRCQTCPRVSGSCTSPGEPTRVENWIVGN